MSKGKQGNNFTPEWFESKGYTPDGKGGYNPPPFRNPLIAPKKPFCEEVKSQDHIRLFKNYPAKGDIESAMREIKNQSWVLLNQDTEIAIKGDLLMVFDVTPIGKPRMTQSDKWKNDPFHPDPKKRQRKPVTQYFKFKDAVRHQALISGFKMPLNGFHVVFIVPMPHSWKQTEKSKMNGTPHQQKPDLDNACKALFDSLLDEDKLVWDFRATKYWGYSGKILIYKLD